MRILTKIFNSKCKYLLNSKSKRNKKNAIFSECNKNFQMHIGRNCYNRFRFYADSRAKLQKKNKKKTLFITFLSSDISCSLTHPTSHQSLKKKHINYTTTINPILLSDALYTYKSLFYPTKK